MTDIVSCQGRSGPPGCLALASGHVALASKWATTSNVEVGQTTYTQLTGAV